MADAKKEQEREELHRAIWSIADDLRGSVDGWDFKSYVLGIMFYRYISENLTNYINADEWESGDTEFDYTILSDEDAEQARDDMIRTKGLELRSKEELIEQFLERVNVNTNVESDRKEFVRKQKDIDLNKIISTCRLKPEETRTFIANSFRDGILRTTGIDFDQILPPVSRFGGGREKIKNEVLEELKKYFDKYFGLVTPDMTFGVHQYQVSENAGYVMVAESQIPLDIS